MLTLRPIPALVPTTQSECLLQSSPLGWLVLPAGASSRWEHPLTPWTPCLVGGSKTGQAPPWPCLLTMGPLATSSTQGPHKQFRKPSPKVHMPIPSSGSPILVPCAEAAHLSLCPPTETTLQNRVLGDSGFLLVKKWNLCVFCHNQLQRCASIMVGEALQVSFVLIYFQGPVSLGASDHSQDILGGLGRGPMHLGLTWPEALRRRGGMGDACHALFPDLTQLMRHFGFVKFCPSWKHQAHSSVHYLYLPAHQSDEGIGHF